MKKLIIIKLVVIIVLTGLCIFLYIKYFNMKNDNELLRIELDNTKLDIDKTNLNVNALKIELEELNEEKKDSIWELDSWKLMKEKIEKALQK